MSSSMELKAYFCVLLRHVAFTLDDNLKGFTRLYFTFFYLVDCFYSFFRRVKFFDHIRMAFFVIEV
jgi:hypothetical protein